MQKYDGNYHVCTGQDDDTFVWYNSNLNSVIFSRSTFTLTEPSITQSFVEFILNPLQKTRDLILNVIRPRRFGASESYDFVDNLKDFDKLYVAKTKEEVMIMIQSALICRLTKDERRWTNCPASPLRPWSFVLRLSSRLSKCRLDYRTPSSGIKLESL